MNTANDNVKDILDMNNYRVEKLKQTKKEIKILFDDQKLKQFKNLIFPIFTIKSLI